MIRIAIAEDHTLLREGLRAILGAESTLSIVAECSEGRQTLEMVRKHNPDVLLLDLRLPNMHGLEVLREVSGETAVLVVSMYSDLVVESIRSGAKGYILKDCSAVELMQAIRTVAQGGIYVGESLRSKTLTGAISEFGKSRKPELTKREYEVMRMAAEGKTSADISQTLGISRRTAEAHRANLMQKLALKSQTELVLYAVRTGLVRT
jgi:DNA-binding NarL/FixJ family response regulator